MSKPPGPPEAITKRHPDQLPVSPSVRRSTEGGETDGTLLLQLEVRREGHM